MRRYGRIPAVLGALATGVALLSLAGCEWFGMGGGGQPAMKLYVLECGHNQVKDQSVFSPGVNEGVGREMAINCYVIQHPEGNLIWGTGLNDALVEKPEGVLVANDNFRITRNHRLPEQLAEIGIPPEEMDYVSMSHLHPDHSGNANLFTDSTLLIQEDEWNAAFGDNPGQYAFNPDLYGELRDSETVKLNGDHDVFGDGSVVIKRTIGHTPGHQSLFLDLPQTGPLVLSGDLWHFAAQREHQRVPKFNWDREKTLASMEQLEAFIAEREATVWIEHDIAQNRAIAHAPAFHE